MVAPRYVVSYTYENGGVKIQGSAGWHTAEQARSFADMLDASEAYSLVRLSDCDQFELALDGPQC